MAENFKIEIGTSLKSIDGISKTYDDKTLMPSKEFNSFFNLNVVSYYRKFFGPQGEFSQITWNQIRTKVIEKGKADFDKAIKINDIEIPPQSRCIAYCYSNMRQHLLTLKQVLKYFFIDFERQYFFKKWFVDKSFILIDIGCGPMTAALSVADLIYEKYDQKASIKYFGVDSSNNMLNICEKLKDFNSFANQSEFNFVNSPDEVQINKADKLIVINYSYFFFNIEINSDTIDNLIKMTNELEKYYWSQPILIIYQNPNFDNPSFEKYVRYLKFANSIFKGMNRLKYINKLGQENKETVFKFEVLGNSEAFKALGLMESFNKIQHN